MKLTHIALITGALTFAGAASATAISGTGLQNGLNAITDGSFYDVNTSQYNPDETWEVTSSGASVTRLIFEFAGFENQASFGIYDLATPSTKLEIFNGASCGTADTTCTPAGNLNLVIDGASNMFSTLYSSAVFSSDQFGYYLTSGAGTFYSQSALNGDSDSDGVSDDHMVAFAGDGSLDLDINGGTNYKNFAAGEYILAWEDLVLLGSDRDYSDFVVMVESVRSVFEPGSMALFGLGIAGLAASRRRQKGLVA